MMEAGDWESELLTVPWTCSKVTVLSMGWLLLKETDSMLENVFISRAHGGFLAAECYILTRSRFLLLHLISISKVL